MANGEPTNSEMRDDLETGLLKLDLSDFGSIGGDALELSLDTFLQDGVLKDIPVVGVVAKLYSAADKLHSFKIQKNILRFFQEYSNGTLDELKRQQFLANFQKKPKYRQEVLDIILISLEQFDDTIQARVLANLIIAHIEGKIKFGQLRACVFALQRLNPVAYEYLDQLSRSKTPYTTHSESPDREALLYPAGIASRYGSMLSVSQVGKDLFVYGIKPLS